MLAQYLTTDSVRSNGAKEERYEHKKVTVSNDLVNIEMATGNIAVRDSIEEPSIIPPITEWPSGRTPRNVGATAQGGNVVYILGGQLTNNSFQSLCDGYDLSTGQWIVLPSLPIGGMAGTAFVDPSDGSVQYTCMYYQNNSYEHYVRRNDGTWGNVALNAYCIPDGANGIGTYYSHTAVYNHNGHDKINMVRGVDQVGLVRWNDRVYDLATKAWSDAPSNFPFNGYGHEIVSDGTSLYLSGGGGGNTPLNTIYKWDGSVWSLVYTHSSAMTNRKPIYHNEFIYYFGGYINGTWKKDVLKFNVITNEMTTLSSNAGPWDYFMYIGYYAGGIFGLGLFDLVNNINTNKIFRFDINNNTWTISS